MAQPLVCDVCEAQPGVALITQVQSGDVMAVCALCAPDMLVRLAHAMSAATSANGSTPAGDGADDAEAEPPPAEASAPRGKRRTKSGDAEAAGAPEIDQEAATAASEPG